MEFTSRSRDPFDSERTIATAGRESSRAIRLRLRVERILRNSRAEPPRRYGSATSLLDELLEAVTECCGAPMGDIQLFDASSDCLRIRVHKGLKPSFLKFFAEVKDGTAWHRAFAQGTQVAVEDVSESPVFSAAARNAMLSAGVMSVQSLALRTSSSRHLGVISVHYPRIGIPRARREILAERAPGISEVVEMATQWERGVRLPKNGRRKT